MDENGSTEDGDVDQAWPTTNGSLERLDDATDSRRRRRRLLLLEDFAYTSDRALRSTDSEFVYPQRQFARTELVVPGSRRGGDDDDDGLEAAEEEGEQDQEEEQGTGDEEGEGSCRPTTGAEDAAGNRNGRRGGRDALYDDLVDFLPNIRSTFARFDRRLLDRSGGRDRRTPRDGDGDDGGDDDAAAPAAPTGELGSAPAAVADDDDDDEAVEDGEKTAEATLASLEETSQRRRGGGGGGGSVDSSIMKLIKSLGMMTAAAADRPGGAPVDCGAEEEACDGGTVERRLDQDTLDRVADKVDSWINNQGQLIDENRQLYEGEGGSPRLKAEETLDKVLAVVVEHQNKINELKLTVFAQQQHILSLEEERQNNALLSMAIDNQLTCEQSGCKGSNENEGKAQGKEEDAPKTGDDQAKSSAESTALSSSSPMATLAEPLGGGGCCTSSKMSDVLLCDEGEYALCQGNQPEGATDEAMTNLRCLCHQRGASCGNFAQVQLVGHLPYLMDSPLDTEVAGVLARPKIRPFAVADLPYVRQRTAGRNPQENVQFDFDVFK